MGRVKRNTATQDKTIICMAKIRTDTFNITEMLTITTIDKMLIILARGAMALWVCQFRIKGPKILWLINHVCNRGDERENANAATSIKEVVGSKGMNIPSVPKLTQMQPKQSQKIRLGENVLTMCLALVAVIGHD